MAKVTITLVDSDDEKIETKFRFDPPMKRGDRATGAQKTAGVIAELLTELYEGQLDAVNGMKVQGDRN